MPQADLREDTYTGVGVDRTAVDVEVLLRQHLGALVDGATRTVEDTAQHVLGDTELQTVPRELDFGLHLLAAVFGRWPAGAYLLDVDARRALEDLHLVSCAVR